MRFPGFLEETPLNKPHIAIVDYGMGNLGSVEKALRHLGHDALVSSQPADITAATHIILPGVGAFSDAMAALRQSGLVPVLQQAVAQGKPFLGICLGMQLLFERSHEDGLFDGLGLLPGEIEPLPAQAGLKIPHMGWNDLSLNRACPLFNGLPDLVQVYFVHSYYLNPSVSADVTATAQYGVPIGAAVQRGALFATQFHPEKSGAVGLMMLDNFARFSGGVGHAV